MFPTSDADFVGPFALLQIVRTFFDAHYFVRCWPNRMFRSFVHRLYVLCFIVLSFSLMEYASVLHDGWSKGCYYTEKVGRMKTARWILYVYTYTSPNRVLQIFIRQREELWRFIRGEQHTSRMPRQWAVWAQISVSSESAVDILILFHSHCHYLISPYLLFHSFSA
jgi:hypothetical protein